MPTVDTTEIDIFRALGDYVKAAVGAQHNEIVLTPTGNNPLPYNAVVMHIIDEVNMDTQTTKYDEENGKAYVSRSVQARVQLDFYGSMAGQRSRIIDSLWRTNYSVDTIKTLTPLFVNSRHRDPYINDSQAYENRWILDLALQYNPVVEHDQDFVDEIDLTINQAN